MFGSASAETSATVRRGQPESVCQAGFGSYAEQPEPDPDHFVSVFHVVPLRLSFVPPTDVTYGDSEGYSTP